MPGPVLAPGAEARHRSPLLLLALLRRALAAPAVLLMSASQGACLGQQDAWTPFNVLLAAGALNTGACLPLAALCEASCWAASGARATGSCLLCSASSLPFQRPSCVASLTSLPLLCSHPAQLEIFT